MVSRPICRRRHLLRAAGACLVAVATAGCTTPGGWLSAPPVGLTAEGIDDLEMVPASQLVFSKSAFDGDYKSDIGRTDFTTNVAVYTGVLHQQGRATVDEDWNDPDPDSRAVGVMATPTLSVFGEARNPLAKRPVEDVVDDPVFEGALRCGGVGGFQWVRPPVTVGEQPNATLLETSTPVVSFVAVIAPETGDRSSLLVHLARAQDSDTTVIVTSVQRRRVPEGWHGDEMVGSDGLLTDAQLSARQRFATDVTGYATLTNPILAGGGTDEESPETVRRTTPDSLQSVNGC